MKISVNIEEVAQGAAYLKQKSSQYQQKLEFEVYNIQVNHPWPCNKSCHKDFSISDRVCSTSRVE